MVSLKVNLIRRRLEGGQVLRRIPRDLSVRIKQPANVNQVEGKSLRNNKLRDHSICTNPHGHMVKPWYVNLTSSLSVVNRPVVPKGSGPFCTVTSVQDSGQLLTWRTKHVPQQHGAPATQSSPQNGVRFVGRSVVVYL